MPAGYQFGILRLLVLTAACAGVVAFTRRMEVPLPFQVFATCFLLVLVIYAVLRFPYVLSQLRRNQLKLRQIRARRQQLEDRIVRSQSPRSAASDEPAE